MDKRPGFFNGQRHFHNHIYFRVQFELEEPKIICYL